MPYDKDFFQRYEAYLEEPTVRTNHNHAFARFREISGGSLRVIDLGCGLGEFCLYGIYVDYLGIDLNPPNSGRAYRAGDWRLGIPKGLPFVPNAFVSLFSIEPFLPAEERYALYTKIFAENPKIRYGLSAGFYYLSQSDEEQVIETGGIVSYQSISTIGQHPTHGFHEERAFIHTPSTMFGDDVMEVWKTFVRD